MSGDARQWAGSALIQVMAWRHVRFLAITQNSTALSLIECLEAILWDLVTYIYVRKLGQSWFGQWLGAMCDKLNEDKYPVSQMMKIIYGCYFL